MKTTLALVFLALLTGCQLVNFVRYGDGWKPQQQSNVSDFEDYVIHDTVHDDYYIIGHEYDKQRVTSWGTKAQARRMTWLTADYIIWKYRTQEQGEYADTGTNRSYPLQIERIK